MTARKKTTVDLEEARRQITAIKTTVISMGLPYSLVRRMDDALKVVDELEKFRGKPK